MGERIDQTADAVSALPTRCQPDQGSTPRVGAASSEFLVATANINVDKCAGARMLAAEPDRARRTERSDFTGALAALNAQVATGLSGTACLLDLVAEGAAAAIPGVVGSAVVVMNADGQLSHRSAVGELPDKIIDLQNAIGEGPTLYAATHAGQIYIPDIEAEQRWPLFRQAAIDLGLRGLICTPLEIGNRVLGTLSLAATEAMVFDPEANGLAEVFATYAAGLIAANEQTTNLQTALNSRTLISQATGMLMERYQLNAEKAFALLVRVSQTNNIKLRKVCEELCTTGRLDTGLTS